MSIIACEHGITEAFDSVICPVCLGVGVISDRMPVSDALADAETAFANDPDRGRVASTRSNLELAAWLGPTAAGLPSLHVMRDQIREAARAAFKACPGLRG